MAVERGERRGGGCLSCCFGGGDGDGEGEELGQRAARALRTSSRWVRDRAVELPEMVARAGGRRRKPHLQHHQQQQLAGEFRYDPVSYALNFEEDGDGEAQPFKYMAFSARLPASPPPPTALPVDRGS
ncbi:uncharacterized protein LOC127781583 [Oryza glaberrima]|uniref:Uncharacterized protein n=2 Tax=Oryza TaxID=4527 RepID=A0A0D3GYL2_9ORYZ|nr:uncharacterized protein LOC127781583 [Oryza glaberrima]